LEYPRSVCIASKKKKGENINLIVVDDDERGNNSLYPCLMIFYGEKFAF